MLQLLLNKQEEKDKIFIGPACEDLHSQILMNPDLLSLTSVRVRYNSQGEEARRKVINSELKIFLSETYTYTVNKLMRNGRLNRRKQPDLKRHHCHNLGRSTEWCWILHLELMLDFEREKIP